MDPLIHLNEEADNSKKGKLMLENCELVMNNADYVAVKVNVATPSHYWTSRQGRGRCETCWE